MAILPESVEIVVVAMTTASRSLACLVADFATDNVTAASIAVNIISGMLVRIAKRYIAVAARLIESRRAPGPAGAANVSAPMKPANISIVDTNPRTSAYRVGDVITFDPFAYALLIAASSVLLPTTNAHRLTTSVRLAAHSSK